MENLSHYNPDGSKLRKAQLRMLEILTAVDEICTRHKIRYWLSFGTLLGAVRHGGFIPWDDDLDICIMRDDYKRFAKVLNDELPPYMALQDNNSDSRYFTRGLYRIRDKDSYLNEEAYKIYKEQGLLIDVFLMEKMPSLSFKRWIRKFNLESYLYTKEIAIYGNSKRVKGKLYRPLCNLLISIAHIFSQIHPTKKLSMHYLTDVAGFGFIQFSKNDIFPLIRIKFENREFLVPNNYGKILTQIYGDYMTLPPINKRHATGHEFRDNYEIFDHK